VLETGTSDFNEVKNNTLTLPSPSQYVVLIGAHSTQSGNQFHVP